MHLLPRPDRRTRRIQRPVSFPLPHSARDLKDPLVPNRRHSAPNRCRLAPQPPPVDLQRERGPPEFRHSRPSPGKCSLIIGQLLPPNSVFLRHSDAEIGVRMQSQQKRN